MYSKYGDSTCNNFFVNAVKKSTEHMDKINMVNMYGIYLRRQSDTLILNQGISTLENEAKNDPTWWVKLYSYYALANLKEGMQANEKLLGEKLALLKKNKKSPADEITKVSIELQNAIEQRTSLDQVLASIRKAETDEKVKAYYINEE